MTSKHPRSGHEECSIWASAIDASIAKAPDCCVRRAVVLESTPSTMDAIDEQGDADDGLLVVALRQTHGRGQRGRRWDDGDGHTLACTFAINASAIDPKVLSTLVACAVHETICGFVPQPSRALIKWPNDIVVRDAHWKRDRKLAGVLIEQRGRRAAIGIGINCTHQRGDWPKEIQGNAISLAQARGETGNETGSETRNRTGGDLSKIDLLCRLIDRLSHWLAANNPDAVRNWFRAHDAMVGTPRAFRVGHVLYEGVVERIEPFEYIVIQSATQQHTLPIAQTQHVHAESMR